MSNRKSGTFKVKKYSKMDFFEFYSIVKHVLNEDVWYLIYNLAMPEFQEGNKVIKDNSIQFSNNNEYIPTNRYINIKIIGIYYNNYHNKYVYSYKYMNGICFYALEEKLNKIESN